MKRHEMRKAAFILVFEKTIIDIVSVDEVIQNALDSELFEVNDECRELFIKTVENFELIDNRISENLRGWTISRISKVSLAIMRLAICEMLFFDDTPNSVAINEAVELAKEFSTEEDASFINGVLGSVEKTLPKEDA